MDVLRNIRVAHQARGEDLNRVAAYYAEEGIDADVQEFFGDVPTRMSEAQLIISRAGASSIADISVIGRPSILIPYAAATGDHQTANAQALKGAGASILVPESRLNHTALSEQIETIMTNPQGASQMSRAALSCAMPDATQDLANLVQFIAQKGTA